MGPDVAALQVARPGEGPGVPPMLTFAGSETDHITFVRLCCATAQPDGTEAAKAANCCVFAGAAAVWSTVAEPGETVIDPMKHRLLVFPPQPARTIKSNAKAISKLERSRTA
jgi:hypothetical protein